MCLCYCHSLFSPFLLRCLSLKKWLLFKIDVFFKKALKKGISFERKALLFVSFDQRRFFPSGLAKKKGVLPKFRKIAENRDF